MQKWKRKRMRKRMRRTGQARVQKLRGEEVKGVALGGEVELVEDEQ